MQQQAFTLLTSARPYLFKLLMPATLKLIDDPYRLCPRADRRAHRAVVHHVRQAIQNWPTNMHLWAEWEELLNPSRARQEAVLETVSALVRPLPDGRGSDDARQFPQRRAGGPADWWVIG